MNKDKKIIVTGVKGQLGYDVVRELNERGYTNVLGIDKEELDITDEVAVHNFINLHRPDIIIHNAAWTAVDKAEDNPDLVYKVTVDATPSSGNGLTSVTVMMSFDSNIELWNNVESTFDTASSYSTHFFSISPSPLGT